MNSTNHNPNLKFQEYKIDHQAWPQFQTDIEAVAKIAYHDNHLLIEFVVKEPFIQSEFRNPNGPVHKDSCVEFFVRFDDDENYYNLELNALGNTKLAYGPGRNNRTRVPEELINQIERKVYIKPINKAENLLIEWSIFVAIPLQAFGFHQLENLNEHQMFGNFYKCADDYDAPHYLSWSAIKSEHPDFHRPEYFRPLSFL